MPASDSYATEIEQLRAGMASGVVTIESNGRRKTYRSVSEIQTAIDYFEGLVAPRKRRTRFRRVSIGTL